MDYLSDLNIDQRAAVLSNNPHQAIVAGPGTGKTKTLVSKLIHLLDNHSPSDILVLTFTKKAAEEIKERVAKSGINSFPFVGTFHSFAFSRLDNPHIISPSDQLKIIKEICQNKNIKPKDLLSTISLYKNTSDQKVFLSSEYYDAYKTYSKYLSTIKLLDYDDLLIELKNQGQVQFDIVLVDEFQDTNPLQYEIFKNICKTNFFVIGDPLQAIYSFRGSERNIFQKLISDYPDTERLSLTTNYRSGRKIIDTSHCLFPESPNLKPNISKESAVVLTQTFNEYTEAEYIVSEIAQRVGGLDMNKALESSADFSDFAVIYRTHSIGRVLKKKFLEKGIPFQMVGGGSFYEKSEIKFLTNILKYLLKGEGLKEIKLSKYILVSKLKNLDKHKKDLNSSKVSEVLDDIIANFRLISRFPKKKKTLEEFCSLTVRFDKNNNPLLACVEFLSGLENKEYYDPSANAVTLLTMHAAKGLEFSEVFICACEERVLPFKEENYEEEKRLFYVAITRGKTNVYLSFCKTRFSKPTKVSPFISLLGGLEKQNDAYFERQQNSKERRKLKKSQMSLF